MKLKFVNKENAYIIKHNEESITLSLFDNAKNVSISKSILKKEEVLIQSIVNNINGIIAVLEFNSLNYYVHIKNNNIYISPYLNGYSNESIDLKVDVLCEEYQLIKTKYSYKIIDQLNNSYELDYKIFLLGANRIEVLKRKNDEEPNIYLKIQYNKYITFLEYKLNSASLLLRTLNVSVLYNSVDIKFTALSNNNFKLSGLSLATITRSKLHNEKEVVVDAKASTLKFKPILLIINNNNYIIEYLKEGKIKLTYNKKTDLLIEFLDFKVRSTLKGTLFEGDIIHKYENIKVDTIVNNKGVKLADIQWLNSHRAKFYIPNTKLTELEDVHNTLYVGYGSKVIYPLYRKSDNDLFDKVLCYKNHKTSSIITRVNLSDNYSVTLIPQSPIYSKLHQIKIIIANKLSLYLKRVIKTNVNLYFEKDASYANESGFATFEEVKRNEKIKSINKYVIDGTSNKYKKIKEKYGKDIIKRFSFKHYLYIFLSTNFISSELSNHVLSVRVYNYLLSEKIRQTPLYFLQHGIMFAKPVDNPMALGFHKENQTNNLIKSVVSSDLESKEFYKMGYTDADLMKTGLPKLDKSHLNPEADKIAFMPTWRYWEEGSIVNGELENTTYYKTLIEFITTFEEAGLLDRLLLVPHNKFADYLNENFQEYEGIISTNPTEALKHSVIFITDFSSIIYDATYRGAFPIFYWKEKDYLIQQYKSIPPVNEENAPGKIAKTNEELISIVKEAINNNYKIPEDVQEKYLRINEFNDNKNTERVINELQSLNVL